MELLSSSTTLQWRRLPLLAFLLVAGLSVWIFNPLVQLRIEPRAARRQCLVAGDRKQPRRNRSAALERGGPTPNVEKHSSTDLPPASRRARCATASGILVCDNVQTACAPTVSFGPNMACTPRSGDSCSSHRGLISCSHSGLPPTERPTCRWSWWRSSSRRWSKWGYALVLLSEQLR
jgi:hypothetical protein